MKNYVCLNMESYCNHRLFYEENISIKQGETDIGIDNHYILKKDLKLKTYNTINGVKFRVNFGAFDNLIAEGQRLVIERKCSKIHFLCLTNWGDVNEHLKVIYEDGAEEIIKVPFFDWDRPVKGDSHEIAIYGSDIQTAFGAITSGIYFRLVYFHHCTFEVDSNKKVKALELPDNVFVHIFAVTMEV